VNFYNDININCPVTPYVGAGLGYGYNRGMVLHSQGPKYHFAYQFIGGVSYPLNPKIPIALEYRFLSSRRGSYDNNLVLNIKKYF